MRIAVLPGDGIGKEIIDQGVKTLHAVERAFGHSFELTEYPIGWAAIDQFGHPLPDQIKQACFESDAMFLGAMGLPGRDETLPQELRPERAALLPLREGNFANLRPIWLPPSMTDLAGHHLDILIVRELTGGIYFGQPRGRETVDGKRRAVDTMVYTDAEIERIARIAFDAARKRRRKVCSVDKANILACSALWREVVIEVSKDYPDVELSHQLVDSAAPLLIQRPEIFDVILTGNMFGDILSDLGAALAGSLGMLPSASIGAKAGLYEPAHGSAPDIAGQDKANPIATILTAGLMLKYSFGMSCEAETVRAAVAELLDEGYRTGDLADAFPAEDMKTIGTAEMGDLIADRVERLAKAPA